MDAPNEAYPYPARDPRDEAKRLVSGSPSHLVEIEHFIYGGRVDAGRPFRALVAGGGTGDATVMIAQHLHDRGMQAEVIHLDPAQASRKIAEARAAARNLANVRFVTAAIPDLPALGLGTFDYIDCCGVLGQLDDPAGGLRLLAGALAPDGGMGMMLFGRLGRMGVEPVQAVLRALVRADEDPQARVALARRLLLRLPQSNWLRRNPWLDNHLTNDPALFDLLLHAKDTVYDLGEIAAMLAAAELRLVSLLPPARYQPATYLHEPALLRRIEHLDMLQQAALAEQLAGDMKTHTFYVVRAGNPVAAPTPDRPEVIPVLRDLEAARFASTLKAGGMLNAQADGTLMQFPLPSLAPAIAAQIDGKRALGEIHMAVKTARADLDWAGFQDQFARLYTAMNGMGRMFLRLPS